MQFSQQWQPLFSQSNTMSPISAMASNTVNVLTCSAAGLLPPTTPFTLPPATHHLPAIADEILSAMLSSNSPSHHLHNHHHPQHQQQQKLHGSHKASQSIATQKRSFCTAFPDLSNEIGDEDGSTDDNSSQQEEKKGRRLSSEQVRALEKAFEEDNKLEPDRKGQLANELSLQPRQVAIWFQNRRARWKTKQMERDYGSLKEKFEAMKAQCDALLKEKENLQAEVARLKGDQKLKEGLIPSYFEATSVIEPINIIDSSSSEQKGESRSPSDTDDNSHCSGMIEIFKSPQELDSNVYLISKNFIDPADLLANAAMLLDVPELFLYETTQPNSENDPTPMKNEEGGGLSHEGNVGWSLPFDWWE